MFLEESHFLSHAAVLVLMTVDLFQGARHRLELSQRERPHVLVSPVLLDDKLARVEDDPEKSQVVLVPLEHLAALDRLEHVPLYVSECRGASW